MAIEIVDVIGLAHERKRRKMIMDTRKMHAWMHTYPNPGDHDDMHCHPGDQTFLLLEGECTMHFPDGGASVLKPGMVALIEGGSFYKLENTGTGPMVLMASDAGARPSWKHAATRSIKPILRSARRNNSAPASEVIRPPSKAAITRRRSKPSNSN